jgi:sensor histidine kinase YesM
MGNDQPSYYHWIHYKITAKDLFMHLVLTPSLIVLTNYWLLGLTYFSSFPVFISTTIIASIVASVLSVTNMRSMFATRRKFPHLNQTWKRLLISFGLYASADFVGGALILIAYAGLPFFEFTITVEHVIKLMVVLLLSATLAGLGYEFFYSFSKWKDSIEENEKLQKLQAQAELSALKSQVNPHFLFNSLNTLSSLIADDAERAERYLDEMTKVYRYLLRNNELELTTLEVELQFIQSYFHLLKTRYGAGISLYTDIEPRYTQHQLPPMTLQLLVENAVKHNTFMKDKPLTVRLMTTEDGELIISNNLQLKKTAVASNKVGLSNIASKYQLLQKADIQVLETDTTFTVVLPLIEPKAGSPERLMEKDLASLL